MLFLVISTPEPKRPSEVREYRQKYWPWAQDKLDRGLAKSFYARTGRGAVALFDVTSNEELHGLLNEWAEIVPAEFDIYPLIDPEAIKAFLAKDAE
jgi:muconolactone delta-isomerase